MNKKELSKYYHLTNEIKDLQEKIKELDLTLISSPLLTGMPHSNKVSNPTEQRNILILTLKKIRNKRSQSYGRINKNRRLHIFDRRHRT